MTYNVFGGTLNLAQSDSVGLLIKFCTSLAVPQYANAADLNVNIGKYMTFVASFLCPNLNWKADVPQTCHRLQQDTQVQCKSRCSIKTVTCSVISTERVAAYRFSVFPEHHNICLFDINFRPWHEVVRVVTWKLRKR